MVRIGVTGGIGSGKSTVCSVFSGFGVPVYDSDTRAKQLIQQDSTLRNKIISHFGSDMYDPAAGQIHTSKLAAAVFSDPDKLHQLNALVHPAVFDDLEEWAARQSAAYILIESALLFTTALIDHVHYSLVVVAPADIRISRVEKRDNADRASIERRIENQLTDEMMEDEADFVIKNNASLGALKPVILFYHQLFLTLKQERHESD